MEKKTNIVEGKEYTYISLTESKDFFCSRCQRNKKSKKYAEYTEQGSKKVICNGCYGALCAKAKK